MPFFLVTMEHPDGDGWGEQLQPHVDFLKSQVRKGKLRASGPLKGTTFRSGFLVFQTENHEELNDILAQDPFWTKGLIQRLTVQEWDPLFGCFSKESSGQFNDIDDD